MANVLINENTMSAIGNSIREKTGSTELILPADMPSAIESIPGGGDEVTVEFTHAANNTSLKGNFSGIDHLVIKDGGFSNPGAYTDLIGIDHITINQPNRTTVPNYMFARSTVKRITFSSSTANYDSFYYFFYGCSYIEVVDGDYPIDFSSISDSSKVSAFVSNLSPNLRSVRFAKDSLKVSNEIMYYAQNDSNDRATRISFANCLDAGASTQESPKSIRVYGQYFNDITGSVIDGEFVDDGLGTTSLIDFITTVKGWTITT